MVVFDLCNKRWNLKRLVVVFGIFLFISLVYQFLLLASPIPCDDFALSSNMAAGNAQAEVGVKAGMRVDSFPPLSISKLKDSVVPNEVHFVWCGDKLFDFVNYLSVLSAWKIIRPDIMIFHYQQLPKTDPHRYHLWFDEVIETIPMFTLQEIPTWAEKCGLPYGLAVLNDRGGVLIQERTILNKNPLKEFGAKNIFLSVEITNSKELLWNGFITGRLKIPELRKMIQASERNKLLTLLLQMSRNFTCFRKPESFCENSPCISLTVDLYPKDVFLLDNQFGEFVRRLYYGSAKLKTPVGHLLDHVPKIVHYIWFGTKELTFSMYLSLKSTLAIIKPELVMIHGNVQLSGECWEKVKNDSRIVWIFREVPITIYGHRLLYTQHKSDIVRADILLKYGGIYLDWDVFWLKPVDDLLQTSYDVIVDFDHFNRYSYPDSINMGVILSKPNARFIKLWLETMKKYKTKEFTFNAVEMPYKVYERYPDTVLVEKRLQVMCYMLICHPVWLPGYKNTAKGGEFNWKKDAYAIHFTYPDPKVFENEAALLSGKGMFADIGRYILTVQ